MCRNRAVRLTPFRVRRGRCRSWLVRNRLSYCIHMPCRCKAYRLTFLPKLRRTTPCESGRNMPSAVRRSVEGHVNRVRNVLRRYNDMLWLWCRRMSVRVLHKHAVIVNIYSSGNNVNLARAVCLRAGACVAAYARFSGGFTNVLIYNGLCLSAD